MKYIKLISIALFAICAQTSISAQEIVWKKLASLPQPSAGGGAAVIGNKIYFVASGHSARTETQDFYVYDIALNKWEQLTDIPDAKGNMAVEAVSGKVFVIGGDPFTKTNFIYRPETNKWDSLLAMPTGRQHIDGEVINNKIYVIGGLTSWSNFTKKTEVYDVATNTWEEKEPISTLRNNPATAVLGSSIYVIGGAGSETDIWKTIATVECYNTETDTWTTKSNLPNMLFKPSAVTVNGKIFVLGGQNANGQSLSYVLVYDEENDIWKNTTPLPKINCFAGCVSVGNKIYVIGGTTSDPNWTYYPDVYEGTVINSKEIPDSVKYFGQKPPLSNPEIFAQDIIKGNVHGGPVAISTSGNEIYWVINQTTDQIYFSKYENNEWSKPALASFVKEFPSNSNGWPSFSPDGNRLYFYSNRTGGLGRFDAWYVIKTDTGWSQPVNAGAPYNTANDETSPIFTAKGNAYLMKGMQFSKDPLYYKYSLGEFSDPVKWNTITGFDPWWNIFISPDEDYVIYATNENPDLYICFKDKTGQWGTPVNMGNKINTGNWERFPVVSPDQKYLFFTRDEGGSAKLYWVSASIIDTLKTIAFSNSTIIKTVEKSLNVFPSPTKGVFTVSLDNMQKPGTIAKIFNSEGKLILTTNLLADKSTIDLSNKPKGVYYLKIVFNADTYKTTIIKK